MEYKDKLLLIKDLSARLPYSVVCQVLNGENGFDKDILYQMHNDCAQCKVMVGFLTLPIEYVKPYLRKMDSMSEKEDRDYNVMLMNAGHYRHITDYLNEHHFDYRGLIEKGLAIEAPKDMYNV